MELLFIYTVFLLVLFRAAPYQLCGAHHELLHRTDH